MSEQLWDAPNQQVVRPDESAPWEEGTGGETSEAPQPEPIEGEPSDLDSMTKDELLTYAQSLGVSPANASMTKDEIRAGIETKIVEPV
jgi:hypothetical protein